MAESIVTDVVARISADSTNFVRGMQLAENSVRQMQGSIDYTSTFATKAMTGLGVVAGAVGIGMIRFAQGSFQAAARVNELDVAMQAVGTSTGIGYNKLREATLAVKKNGIEFHAAQQMVLLYANANLDVAKASEISRVAQDLAVISSSNSTETATRLTYAIMNQDTQMLRSVGITKSASEAFNEYAIQNKISVNSLNEMQKKQAITNMILAEGAKVAGVYEAAMTEPAKVLRSFPRIFDDIKESIGQGLTTAFGPLIVNVYQTAKAFSAMLGEGGMFAPILEAIGRAFKFMMEPLSSAFEALSLFLKKKQELFELGAKARQTAQGMKDIEDRTRGMAQGIAQALPFIAGVTAFFALTAGSSLLGALPVIGGFFAGLSALGAGFAVMALMIPAVQKEIMHLIQALKPLAEVAMDVATTIGTVVWTAMTNLMVPVGALIDGIGSLTNFLARNTEAVTAFVAVLALAFISSKLWTGALIVQATVMKVVRTAMALYQGTLIALQTAQKAAAAGTVTLNSVFMVNPVMLLVIAIAALVAGLVYLWNTSETARKVMTTTFDAIGKVVGFVVGWILKGLGMLLQAYSQLTNSSGVMGQFFVTVWTAIGNIIGTVVSFVLGLYGRILTGLSNMIASHGTFYNFLRLVFNSLLKIVTTVIGGILNYFALMLFALGDLLSGTNNFGKKFKEIFETMFKAVLSIGKSILGLLGNLVRGVIKLGANLWKSLSDAVTGNKSTVEDYASALDSTGQKTLSWNVRLGNSITGLANKLQGWSKSVIAFGQKDIGAKVVDTIGRAMGLAGDQLTKWSKMAKSFGKNLGGLAKTITDALSAGSKIAGDWLVKTGDSIIAFTANGMTQKIADTIGSFVGNMGDMFGGLGEVTSMFGKKVDSTTEKLDKSLKKLGATAGQLAKTAADAGKAQLSAMKAEAQKVLDFAQTAIDDTNKFGGIMSLGASEDTPVTAEMIVANLQQRLSAISKFGENLRKLRQMGLNDASYQEIIGAGPLAGGKMAQALIDAGKASVGQVNTLQSSISLGADYIGDQAIKSRYGANTGLTEQRGIASTTVQTFASGAFQFHFGAGVDAKTRAAMTREMKTAIKSAFVELKKDLKK